MGTLTIMILVGSEKSLLGVAPVVAEMEKCREICSYLACVEDGPEGAFLEEDSGEVHAPKPDIFIGTQTGSTASATASVAAGLEEALSKVGPDIVVVAGDVNSTFAASLTATKSIFPVARVEAGLRIFDRTLPDETNRIMADAISDYLYVTEKSAGRNLLCEGVPASRVSLVGSVIVDTLLMHVSEILKSEVLTRASLTPREYALLAIDAPATLPAEHGLPDLIRGLERVQRHIPIVFPLELAAVADLHQLGVWQELSLMPNLEIIEQPRFADFARLIKEARFVLTRSGVVQEQSTALRVPCLTLRDSTERPVTVVEGTNTLVGTDAKRIISESLRIIDGNPKVGRIPSYWDGYASRRIVNHLVSHADSIRRDCRSAHNERAYMFPPAQAG